MAYGFKIKDSSNNTVFDSTETTGLQRDEIVTSAGSGSQTYTDCTNQEAYVIPVMQGDGYIGTGTWSAISYGVTTSVDSNNNPKVDYNIQCTNMLPFLGNLCSGITYRLFVFTR